MQVALGYQNGDNVEFACTGTLISSSFILTAAQCINGTRGRPVQVRLGNGNDALTPEIKVIINRYNSYDTRSYKGLSIQFPSF